MRTLEFENGPQLNRLCVELAEDFLLVQGAGGNISSKEGEVLWIKASGTWLAEAKSKEIFIPISKSEVDGYIKNKQFDALPSALNGSTLRPSIETWLHALMPQKFVVHLHALDVLSLLIHKHVVSELEEIPLGQIHWGFVKYEKPGPALALAVSELMSSKPGLEVLFLQNHGIVLAAETIERIVELLADVRGACAQPVLFAKSSSTEPDGASYQYSPVEDNEVHSLAVDLQKLALVRDAWAIAPDHVVFLGATPAIVEGLEELKAVSEMGEKAPLIVFVSGAGVYSREPLDVAGQQQLRAYYEIIVRQKIGQEFNTFTDGQIRELLDWDAEKYRLAVRK